MQPLRLIVLRALTAFALAAPLAVGACGGGEKKADEPTPTAISAEEADPADTVTPTEPTEVPDSEGDDIDSDPLPNPCAGDGN